MYRRLFPDVSTPITWFGFVESDGRCRFEEFMNQLPEQRRGRLKARMLAWAQANNWMVVNDQIMHRIHGTTPPVYELKCHQERVLFVRCGNDAVAFGGFTKKDNWSKRAETALDALKHLARAAAAECGR